MEQQNLLNAFVQVLLGRLITVGSGVAALVCCGFALASPAVPSITISNVPLSLVEPTHPQVLLVVPNSQSMDGSLSGAIMTGSGIVSDFSNSSSPEKYSVPPGFVPPKSAIDGNGKAPYTVAGYDAGEYTLYDNSPSRLNVAKQAIRQVLEQYATNFDFGLMTYDTGNPARHPTWVYYMSASGGFDFSNSKSSPLGEGEEWIANPCYQYENKNGIDDSCEDVDDEIAGDIGDKKYIAIAETSDAPYINDVGYLDNDWPTVCLILEGHSPAHPFPENYDIHDYNNGLISIKYHASTCRLWWDDKVDEWKSSLAFKPTNAGYVPYQGAVLLAKRGFAYQSSQSNSKGDILVDIVPASTGGATTQTEIDTYIAKFTDYLQPETSDPDSDEIKALGGQSPMATLVKWAREYYISGVSGHPKPASNTGCPCNKYVVMLTDGLPTQDLDGDAWPPLGTDVVGPNEDPDPSDNYVPPNGYKVHATFNLDGGGTARTDDTDFGGTVLPDVDGPLLTTSLKSTDHQALADTIDQLQQLADAGVKTFIVGMGAGVDPAKNPAAAATLRAMAIAGGTNDYFPATSPQAVVQAMRVIFAKIQAANQSSTAVAVSSTSFQGDMGVYQARYDSASYGWTGDLVSYPIGISGDVDQVNPNWSARELMEADFGGTDWSSQRLVVTVNSDTGQAVPFRWGNLSTAQQAALETHWNSAEFSNKQNYGKAVLEYLRGNQANTLRNDGVFRNRSWLLGDIVNSAPLYVGSPNRSIIGVGYADFANNYADRTPLIYVGANDGALHAFNADTGHELFAYFPLPVFDRLADLARPTYDNHHQFYVDGAPNGGNVKFADGSWHTVLVGGLNAGGNGVYAFDVTDPSAYTSETAVADKVLWTITANTPGFSHLGLTYSQPQIVKINCDDGPGGDCADGSAATYAVVFGSGYNNDDNRPYLYVVNVETGGLIRSIDLCSDDTGQCSTSIPNGLSTSVTLSTTGGFATDRVYAGDLQGHLWRIDMSDTDPLQWDAKVLFTARNANGDVQSITTQPVVSRSPAAAGAAIPTTFGYGIMVYFGTGRYLGTYQGQPDITNTSVQSFYGVLDTRSAAGLDLARDDLAGRILSATTVAGKSVRTVSGSPIDWNPAGGIQYGWRMALPDMGERSITDPAFRRGRIISTTFAPSTVSCSAGGVSRLMIINSATGGALPQPELDINGDGKLDANDQTSAGENPVGVTLGSGGYAAAPSIVGFNKGPFSDLKLITVSGSSIMSIKERGGMRSSGVQSWSQIR